MNFNNHSRFEGQHSFLSASKYHWIRYDKAKLIDAYSNMQLIQKGTELHAFAAKAIKLGQKLQASKKTLNKYVNDAIGYRMTPEQVLFFSENCFGTADSISFNNNLLRIHDLKTGMTPAHFEQLEIYAALFCLEYDKKPSEIEIELRIYQNDDIQILKPDPEEIQAIMEKIIEFDAVIMTLKTKERM